MSQTLHIISNPAAGSRSAAGVLRSQVLPLLEGGSGLELRIVQHETSEPGGGAIVAKRLLSSVTDAGLPLYLVLLGGDGTTHEVLDGFYNPTGQDKSRVGLVPRIRLALVPVGTANALYASLYPPTSGSTQDADSTEYKLRSVKAMLEALRSVDQNTAEAVPITLALTEYEIADTQSPASPTVSLKGMMAHLITSHALHAAILFDSEALRSEHPGIERFKIAAQQNVSRWVGGTLNIEGYTPEVGQSKRVQRYDVGQDRFVDSEAGERVSINGPFFYLACLSTDRLEPSFVPAPFSSTRKGVRHPRPSHALDLIIVRPTEDPSVRRRLRDVAISPGTDDGAKTAPWWTEERSLGAREAFVQERVGELTIGMYSEGSHVRLRYGKGEEEGMGYDELGEPVVEYLRCQAYEFIPVSPKGSRCAKK